KEPANKEKDLTPVNDNFDPKDPVNKDSGLVWHYGGVAEEWERNFVFGRTISTAAVHNGPVYISELEGYLHCLDAKTGRKYWADELDKSELWGSPYWVDGKV